MKAGEWSNAAATAGKTGYGGAGAGAGAGAGSGGHVAGSGSGSGYGHVEGAKMDAVKGTTAYLEAMTGKSVSVMRIDRKRESHGLQTDGRALF